MARLKHPDLDAVIDVPDSAVPIYGASGWVELSKKDIEAHDRQAVDDARAAEDRMAEAAAASLPAESSPEPEPEPRQQRKTSNKENS
jgi:hypothetical protein